MKLLENAEALTGVKGIEFEEDEIDDAELEAITRPTTRIHNGIPIIPEDDSDDDDFVPILGPRLVNNDSGDSDDECNPHVITDGEDDEDGPNDNHAEDAGDDKNFDDNSDDDEDNDKVHRELANLDADPEDVNLDEGIRTRSRVYFVDVATDKVVFNAEAVNSEGNASKTFRQAEQSELKTQWMAAVGREIDNFMKRDAWKKKLRSELPKGQRPLKVKWVFKIKENETGEQRYKGRIVIKGYTEIPGVDYTEPFVPVATTSAINMVIATDLYREDDGWEIETLDIEAAFVESDMDPNMEVFIEWPDRMVELGYVMEDIKRDFCIKLSAPMYGKVDVPLMFK
jgi:hypothetical protein